MLTLWLYVCGASITHFDGANRENPFWLRWMFTLTWPFWETILPGLALYAFFKNRSKK